MEAPHQWALPESEGVMARLGKGRVEGLNFSPDRKRLAVSSAVGLWLINMDDLTPAALWTGKAANAKAVAFSPSGERIATGGVGAVHIWEAETGALAESLETKPQHWVDHLDYSPDGRWIAADGLHLWSVDKEKNVPTLQAEENKWSGPLAFSPDSRRIACCGSESIAVWDLETGEELARLTNFYGDPYRLAFSPCGGFLAAGGWDGWVRIWSADDWRTVHRSSYADHYVNISYSPEGALRAACYDYGDRSFSVRNPVEKETLYQDREARAGVFPGAFVDGGLLAYFSGFQLKIWELGNAKPRVSNQAFSNPVTQLLFSADSAALAAQIIGMGAALWDIGSLERASTLFSLPVENDSRQFSIEQSPDSRFFVPSACGNAVKLYEIGKETPIAEFEAPILFEDIQAAAFSYAADLAACADDAQNLYLWRPEDGQLLYMIHKRKGTVDSLSFSQNGKYLLVGDIKPLLWDVEERERIKKYKRETLDNAVFSPCSRFIAGIGLRTDKIAVWDIRRREICLSMPIPEAWDLNVVGSGVFAFSPCGRHLAGGADCKNGMKNESVYIWSLEDGSEAAVLSAPSVNNSIAFSPDGSLLAGASESGSILLWDAAKILPNGGGATDTPTARHQTASACP